MLFISLPDCELHDMGPGHPESPLRLNAIIKEVKASPVSEKIKFLEAPLVDKAQLYRVHDEEYVDSICGSISGKMRVRMPEPVFCQATGIDLDKKKVYSPH